MILSAGILTVEDLAGLPDSDLPAIGIGGLSLRDKARAWLSAAEDKGKLAEENAALKLQVTTLSEQVTTLAAEFAKMKANAK
jgi:hypothetical protein